MALNLEDTTELVLTVNAGSVNLGAINGKGPTGPAGADGGSDVSYAGFVSDTTPSLTRAAILAIGGVASGFATLDGNGKLDATQRTSGTAGGVAYGTGTSSAFTAAGTSGQVLTSSGSGAPTWTTPATPSSASLLATTVYNPASGTTLSTTGTSPADVDATNLAVTFTVPASGIVLVMLEGCVSVSTTGVQGLWSLRTGTTDVVGSNRMILESISASGSPSRYRTSIRVTGLTPGASVTYKWAWRVSASATFQLRCGAAGEFSGVNDYGPAIMEVWSA